MSWWQRGLRSNASTGTTGPGGRNPNLPAPQPRQTVPWGEVDDRWDRPEENTTQVGWAVGTGKG